MWAEPSYVNGRRSRGTQTCAQFSQPIVRQEAIRGGCELLMDADSPRRRFHSRLGSPTLLLTKKLPIIPRGANYFCVVRLFHRDTRELSQCDGGVTTSTPRMLDITLHSSLGRLFAMNSASCSSSRRETPPSLLTAPMSWGQRPSKGQGWLHGNRICCMNFGPLRESVNLRLT